MAGERFEFKRLEAYRVALTSYGWALAVAARLARTDAGLGDQLRRAARSMVLNTAEAAGSWRPGNKRKHYAIARGSPFEAAAEVHPENEPCECRNEEAAVAVLRRGVLRRGWQQPQPQN